MIHFIMAFYFDRPIKDCYFLNNHLITYNFLNSIKQLLSIEQPPRPWQTSQSLDKWKDACL